MLQLEQLKEHMVTIGIEKSLRNSAIYEHLYLENIKKLYKHADKCDNQHHYKAIIESITVSAPEIFAVNSPKSPGPSVNVKNSSVRKPHHLFTEVFMSKIKLLSFG